MLLHRPVLLISASVVVLIAAGDVRAQVPEAPSGVSAPTSPLAEGAKAGTWRWSLGLGAAVIPDYEGSEDYIVRPLPFAKAEKGPVNATLFGTHVTSNLIDDPNWRLGPSLLSRRGYGDVDNGHVRDLKHVDRSLEIGAKGGYDFQFAEPGWPRSSLALAVEGLVDVSSESGGYVITPSVAYTALLSERWNGRAGFELPWASDGYMSHYFGITPKRGAVAGLDDHDAEAGFKNVSFNAGVGYRLSEAWNAQFVAQYKRLLGDAEDSPIVDDEGNPNNFGAALFFTYSW